MNASVGPLIARPATNGLTATTGAGESAIASRMPGTARIGPIEITGLEGPITIRSDLRKRCEDFGRRACVGQALDLDALDRRLALVEDQELLKPAPAGGGEDRAS